MIAIWPECPLWVKTVKARVEHLLSALTLNVLQSLGGGAWRVPILAGNGFKLLTSKV